VAQLGESLVFDSKNEGAVLVLDRDGKAQTAIGDRQGRLLDPFQDMKAKQFASANKVAVDEARKQLEVEGGKFAEGHAHRFRDTFAVELSLAGVPLERVSILLGHTSVKITEEH
jgi:integrase